MRKSKPKALPKAPSLPRINYQGNDPAQYILSNRTHRSTSEAFRDAQYASAGTYYKTDFQEAVDFMFGTVLGACITLACSLPLIAALYWFAKQV
jgi:hypothetical protein